MATIQNTARSDIIPHMQIRGILIFICVKHKASSTNGLVKIDINKQQAPPTTKFIIKNKHKAL